MRWWTLESAGASMMAGCAPWILSLAVLAPLASAAAQPPGQLTGQAPAPESSHPDTLHYSAENSVIERRGEGTEWTLEGDVRVWRGDIEIRSRRARLVGPQGREQVFFYDNVRVRHERVLMTGEVGEYNSEADWAEMQENVVVEDSTAVVHAQRGRYYRQTGILWLWGKVDFQDPTTRVQADSITFNERTGLGEAFGNVVLTDRESGSEARGQHGFYDRATADARLDGQPVLALRDSDGAETRIFADQSHINKQSRELHSRGSVRIERGSTVALADSAVYFEEAHELHLRGRPSVKDGDTRIAGREIDVFLGEGDSIERVAVRRGARLVQARPDTSLVPDNNVVRGDSATIFFAAGELQRASIRGNASSIYVPEEATRNRLALNEATADSILMTFQGDDVEEVIFLGNARGTYLFYEGDLDSLRAPRVAVLDTVFGVVRGDTTRFDFRREAEVVEYKAARILYLTAVNDLHLQDDAEVQYQGRTLQAGRIQFDADTDLLTARDRPVLIEGGDRIYGQEMGYDMQKRDSWVEGGSTSYDQGYYHGREIVRKPDGTLFVVDGEYTTCDLAEPHYGFHADEMKIYLHDKVIGRPVWVYLGHIPVGYLPFFFNSTSTKRRSGFLQPDIEFGMGSRSRYIRGLDYYWAASDYWDVLFSSDYNERSRVNRTSVGTVLADTAASRSARLEANLRYKLRYRLEGNVGYSRSHDFASGQDFVTLRGNHQHDVSRNTKIAGTLDFASNDQAIRRNNANTDYERSRQRQLNSSLSLRHQAELGNLSLGLNRTQIVSPDESFINRGTPILSWTQPSLSLTARSIRLAPRPRNPRESSLLQRFFSELQFAPNLSFTRNVDTFRRRRFRDAMGVVVPDTTGIADSLLTEEVFDESLERLNASTSIGLSRQGNLWIFNVTPSISYSESFSKSEGSTDPELRDGRFSHSFRSGSGISTQFFGIFRTEIGRLRAIRHTIEPRATYSYSISSGQEQGRHGVNVSLANRLDIKYQSGSQDLRRDGIIDWSLSSSYDPDRDRKWSTVSSRLTLNRQGPLRLEVSQTYDPYAGKITSTAIPFQLRLAGSLPRFAEPEPEAERNRIAQEEGPANAGADSLAAANRSGFGEQESQPLRGVDALALGGGDSGASWDLGMSYSLRRERGRTLRANVSLGLGVRPTPNWQVRYTAYYDAAAREFTNPSIHIERDLHCWTASFSRVFSGFDREWRYYFRIYVKQHQEDLFLESGDRSFNY